jgi:hypothetical protein
MESLYNSFFTFFLDKKSNKKIKANTNGPARFAGQRHGTSLLFLLLFITITIF